MKNIYKVLMFLFATQSILAQAPESMSYQAVLRDANETLLKNQDVKMRISIQRIKGAVTTTVYIETQTTKTNINGLATIEIGAGITSSSFANIDWNEGPYFIKIETDLTGEGTYSITGTSKLMSVPFAMYAKTSGSSSAEKPFSAPLRTLDELNATTTSTTGLMVYCTDCTFKGIHVFNGTSWDSVGEVTTDDTPDDTPDDDSILIEYTNQIEKLNAFILKFNSDNKRILKKIKDEKYKLDTKLSEKTIECDFFQEKYKSVDNKLKTLKNLLN